MEMAVFFLFAILAVVSALVVITHKNPVYSTMSLVVTFFSVAVLYVLLGAPLIATLQVLIYTGAILVLFLFVIMLLNVGRSDDEPTQSRSAQKWGAILGAGIFAGTIGATFWKSYEGASLEPLTAEKVALKPLAEQLFGQYLLGFEIIGLLLLVAVIGATVLARRQAGAPQLADQDTAEGNGP
jgi:NADH-quinone oxidoreductase subunit J